MQETPKNHDVVACTDGKWCSLKDHNTVHTEVTVLSECEESKLL